MPRLTLETFLSRAREAHGDRYDYSQVALAGSTTKIRIGCPTHGIFEQIPGSHMKGFGCKECADVITAEKKRLTPDQFIARSREKHGDKYDYSKVEYHRADLEVDIICHDHGPFEQMPVAHMEGHGCRHCYADARRLTMDEFLAAARALHGTKYDYAKVEYQGILESVTIVCPVHGDFRQLPSTHLRGSGCQSCNLVGQYSLKAAIRGDYEFTARTGVRTLYVALQIREGEPTFVNIGLAKQGYERRYGASHPYATEGDPDRLALPTELAVLMEQVILRATQRFHHEPAVRFPGGASECRTLEALPIIEEMIADFAASPARLAETPWVEQEARRHGLLHLLEDFRSRVARLEPAV